MNQKKILVVGGGPAGLAAAYAAASAAAEVTVLEKMPSPGRKLLASGGGRCNITNILPPEKMAERFDFRQWRFTLSALKNFSGEDLKKLCRDSGVALESPDGFHYFPHSGRAADVLNLLTRHCAQKNVKIQNNTTVKELCIRDGVLYAAKDQHGIEYPCDALILACGGKSYPSLGSAGEGYILAESAGHRVIDVVPALCGLEIKEKAISACSGNVLENVSIEICRKNWRGRASKGTLLLTHEGISGPAVLDISGEVNSLLLEDREIQIKIKVFPDKSLAFWKDSFELWHREHGKKTVKNLLGEFLPDSLAEAFCILAGTDKTRKACEISGDSRNKLIGMLGDGLKLTVTASSGFDKAMASWGGVSLKEISPDSMESRIVKGLYFAGELMNISAPCGGYNIQWAFSSGMLAGKSAALKTAQKSE